MLQKEAEIKKAIPEIDLIKQNFTEAVLDASKRNIRSNINKDRSLKDRQFELISRQKELLIAHGYLADHLDPVYNCKKCSDKGYIQNGNMKLRCGCFNYLLMKEIYKLPELSLPSDISFDYFDPSLFNGFDSDEKKSKSDYMGSVKNLMTDFCSNPGPKNYYVFGKTGTGKTFLLISMAKQLFENQISSVYLTANNLFKITQEYKAGIFSEEKPDPGLYNFIYSAKVLLVDDLGTESQTASKYAELFDILSIRYQNKLSTVIASNLAPLDLKKTYDERIYSRIMGMFDPIKLQSEDIRLAIKRKSKQSHKGHQT